MGEATCEPAVMGRQQTLVGAPCCGIGAPKGVEAWAKAVGYAQLHPLAQQCPDGYRCLAASALHFR